MSTPPSPGNPASPADPAGGAPNVLPPAASKAASGPGKLAAAAALAGLLAWSVMLVGGYPFFREPSAAAAGGAGVPSPTREELAMMDRRAYLNLTSVMTVSGALLGAAIALAESVGCRRAARVSLTVFASAIAGGCAGAAAAWCGHRMFDLPQLLELDRLIPGARDVVVQAVCWGLVGLGVGVGLTLSACRHPRSVIGGALGGLFSTLPYSMISLVGGILVPAGETPGLVPNSTANRLLWLMTAAVCIGTGIGIAAKGRRPSVRD